MTEPAAAPSGQAPAAAPNAAPAAAPAAPAAAPAAPAAAPADWTAGFDEDTMGYVQNKGWKGPADTLDSYRNLEKLIGAPPEQIVKIPQGEVDAAGWNEAVWNKLGRPMDAAEYNIPVPEGADTSFADWARGAFHEIGMPAGMAEQLMTKYSEFATGMGEQQDAAYQTALAEQDNALKTNWGKAYDQNVGQAKRAAQNLGIDGATIDQLEQSMGFAKVMELFHNIGTKMGEGDFVGGPGGGNNFGVMTPDQAKAQINALRSDQGFIAKYAAGDRAAKEEMEKLHLFAYPSN